MKDAASVSRLIAAVFLLSPVATTAAPKSDAVRLENPSVRLWYEETGRLSQNIATLRDFRLWNTIIGEGSAEENANDALFTVELNTGGEQNIRQTLILSATDGRGKVMARRSMNNLLTSSAGKVTAALWVKDVGCAHDVIFMAQIGNLRRSVRLDFSCGE